MEKFGEFVFLALVGVAVFLLQCLAAMYAWNNVLPDVLHAAKLNFTQAMMLVCLGHAVIPTSSGSKS